MMRNPLRLAHSLLLAGAGLLTTGIAPGCAQADANVEALLQLHHEHRVAHVLRASRRFTVTFADTLIDVSGGVASRRARSDSERQFDAYFSVARFLEWDDVAPLVIHVAKDGTLATVTVAKRVRALVGTAATGIREDAAHFAWTSTWQRSEGTWRVVAIASTERPEAAPERAPLTDRLEAYEILHAAREAVGGQAAVASVSMVSFAAACEGPRGPFTTRVRSARDARFTFSQAFADRPPFEAGVALAGAWRLLDDGSVADALPEAQRGVLRAHELHMLAIGPESRFHSPRRLGRETVGGRAANVVRFVDPAGHHVDFLYAADTGLPLGFRLPQPPGPSSIPVETWFDDWRAVGPVVLPFSVSISQGDDVFRYRVTEASTDWVTDENFTPSSRRVERTFLFDELAPGVLAAVVVPDPPHYAFANTLVVDLGEELLVVDTQQSPAAAEALIQEIRARWTKPVRWVVNTHWHGDHVYGNSAYRRVWPDARFLGHDSLREDLLTLGQAQLDRDRAELPASIEERRVWLSSGRAPDGTPLTPAQRTRVQRSLALRERQLEQVRTLELVPPDSAFKDALTLIGAIRTVRLLGLGPAHTRGDVVVWLPAERILAAGDLVEDAYPWVEDADVRGWARALARIEALDPAVVLPAHGSPWREPVARLAAQRALFREAVAIACAGDDAAPPALASFRELHGLASGEVEQDFWTALRDAVRRSADCG